MFFPYFNKIQLKRFNIVYNNFMCGLLLAGSFSNFFDGVDSRNRKRDRNASHNIDGG